jgi:hypothetical protein
MPSDLAPGHICYLLAETRLRSFASVVAAVNVGQYALLKRSLVECHPLTK